MADKKNKKSTSDGSSNSPKKPRQPSGGTPSYFFWIIAAGILLFYMFSTEGGMFGSGTSIDYSTFREQLRDDNVERVVVQGEEVRGTLKREVQLNSAGDDTTRTSEFITYIPSFGDDNLMEMLEEHDVAAKTIPASDIDWITILIWGIPLMFLIFIGIQFFRQMQMQGKNMFNIGKSKAKLQDSEKVNTTFDDVAGSSGAKTEL
jgi:cell division protease FtsH